MLRRARLRALVVCILCAALQAAAAATCGDGFQEQGEKCDDGNRIAGDGCSPACVCEAHPCHFTVGPDVNLASVVKHLAPGATLLLAAGTYSGEGSCGWEVPSVSGTDDAAITVRGAAEGSSAIIDCNQFGPVVQGIVRGTHLRLVGIHFTRAHVSGRGGAVLNAEGGSHVIFDGCRITECGSDGDGGALLVRNSSLLVSNSHFDQNRAELNGGAVAIVDGGSGIVSDSTFTRNSAANFAGAVSVARASTLEMERTVVSLNIANQGGAVGIYTSSTLNVTSTVIANNTAETGNIDIRDGSLVGLRDDVSIVGMIRVFE
jgi:cysteine-rich repeat protein